MNPYEEENLAKHRVNVKNHILFMEGRFEQLAALGLVTGGHTKLTDKGRAAFNALLTSGFVPDKDLLLDVLFNVGKVDPPAHAMIMADYMLDYDYLVKELEQNHRDGF